MHHGVGDVFLRRRGARSKSPSSPRVVEADVDAGARGLGDIEDEPGTCDTTDFRPTSSSKAPLVQDNSNNSRRHLTAALTEPSHASADHECTQPKQGNIVHFDLSLAAGKPSAPADRKKQQQQRPAVELGESESFARKNNQKNNTCRRFRVPATGSEPPAPFGSEEYLKNRRRRAAQGVEVVRQCAAETDKISSLISDEGARRAQSLVRRLAAEKQRKAQEKADVENEQLPTASLELAKKDEQHGKRQPCAADEHSPEVRLGRRPWRTGASSRASAESRRATDEPQRPGTTSSLGVGGGTSDLVKDQARVAVERIVRRACLNLANRPWRLAGVRLSIDRSNHAAGGTRQRMRQARNGKDNPSAALVKLQAAHDHLASKGAELCGWARRGSEPRHRRLVRPRTSPDASRGLCSVGPSPPPFPHRRYVSSAGLYRGVEADPRQETDDENRNSCRNNPLCDNFEARFLEDFASEGSQGWIPHVGAPEHTAISNGVANEGLLPGFGRKPGVHFCSPPPQFCRTIGHRARGRLWSNRAASKVMSKAGGRTRNLGSASSTPRQLPKRPRWDARFGVRGRDAPAETTTTCGKGDPPSCGVTFEQDSGPRMPCPGGGEDGVPTDISVIASSGGYSTSTFVAETVSSSALPSDNASVGEVWSEAGSTYGDASIGSSSPWTHRRETAKAKKAEPAAIGQADGGDAWHACDAVALDEIQPAINHTAFHGLVEDARVFANRLARLAEGQVLDRDGGGSCHQAFGIRA